MRGGAHQTGDNTAMRFTLRRMLIWTAVVAVMFALLSAWDASRRQRRAAAFQKAAKNFRMSEAKLRAMGYPTKYAERAAKVFEDAAANP